MNCPKCGSARFIVRHVRKHYLYNWRRRVCYEKDCLYAQTTREDLIEKDVAGANSALNDG